MEPSQHKQNDENFAESIKNAGNVILSYYFQGNLTKEGYFLKAQEISLPVPILSENARAAGFINVLPDIDGISRKYPAMIKYKNKLYPSLGFSVIKNYCGLTETEILNRIPVDETGSALVCFYHGLRKFPNYSFIQVLQSYLQLQKGQKPLISPYLFKNKIVLVGYTATGTFDVGLVSGIEHYLKIGVHASFIENFLRNEFIRKAPAIINFANPLILSYGLTAAAIAVPALPGVLFTFFIGCLFCFFAFYLFSVHHIWINIVSVIFTLVFTYLLLTVFRFILEEKEKLKLRSIFQKYVSPSVMNVLLSRRGEITLGGEKKTLTIMFADIKGFTPLTEKSSPERTVELLNEVLNIMVESVFRYRGTLDKFMGDCVMAIFGAPIEEKEHAKKAVLSAIEMVENVEKTRFSNNEAISIGISINTGTMIIGNIGSEKNGIHCHRKCCKPGFKNPDNDRK